jgi:hypothetical protein
MPRSNRTGGKPPRNAAAIVLVLGAEATAQPGLFVEDDEEVEEQPRDRGPCKEDLPAK